MVVFSWRIVNCHSLAARRFTLTSQQSVKCSFLNNGVELEVMCTVCRRISSKGQVGKLDPTLPSETTTKCVLLEEFVGGG